MNGEGIDFNGAGNFRSAEHARMRSTENNAEMFTPNVPQRQPCGGLIWLYGRGNGSFSGSFHTEFIGRIRPSRTGLASPNEYEALETFAQPLHDRTGKGDGGCCPPPTPPTFNFVNFHVKALELSAVLSD